MGRVWGVAAEFNPFHSGHAALLTAMRRRGASHLVAVMSGHVVQRGDFAVTDKWTRAHCALEHGVDLVLELPLAYACAPARRFGMGAVGLLRATGLVEGLFFGSECGDAGRLRQAARLVESPPVRQGLPEHLSRGLTFAQARQQAVAAVDPLLAELLRTPNNNLAIEYLRAARELDWNPEIFTIPRQGAAHDDPETGGGIASATGLRKLGQDFDAMAPHLPPRCLALYRTAAREGRYPAAPSRLDAAILSALRQLPPERLSTLPDLSEGLENRFAKAIRAAVSLEELQGLLKTKRYTLARVRRLILCAYLGVTRADADSPPPYLRVLGFTGRGEELMREMKHTALLPVDTRLARLRDLGGCCGRFAGLEANCTNLYTLCLPTPRPCGWEYTGKGVFLK